MKRLLIILMALTFLLGGGAVLASDVSDAKYVTTIQISNNGTALTNEVAVFDITTADMITLGMLGASATDAAMLTGSGGSDIAFMPSVNATIPWATFVSSIGEDSDLNQYLYSKDVTGGEYYYFPGAGGMSSDDEADLEPGDNFTIEQTGWVDFTSVNATLVYKENAFRTIVSDGNTLTSSMYTVDTWVSPTGDVPGPWIPEANAYDDNEATYSIYACTGGVWTPYLELTQDTLDIIAVRYIIGQQAGGEDINLDLDVYYSSAWHDVFEGVIAQDIWEEKAVIADGVTSIRLRLKSSAGDNLWIYEVDNEVLDWSPSVSATGLSSGDYTVSTSANTTHMWMEIDGTPQTPVALSGASVPDNANDWEFVSDSIALFLERQRIWVNGLQQDIQWEYALTFTDASGNGHDATPTFRTASSDADLTVEIYSQEGLLTSTTPSSVVGGWSLLDDLPATPSNLYTEGGESWGIGDIDMGEKVSEAAVAAGQDPATWQILTAFSLALLALIGVYKTTHNTKIGKQGSLVLGCLAALGVMIYFYKMEVLPGFILIPVGIIMVLLVVWRRSPSPVD